jgi:hypothetical protein
VQFLSKLQELFQSRDRDTLVHQHNVLSETPLHLEVQQLMELGATFFLGHAQLFFWISAPDTPCQSEIFRSN